MLSSGQKTRFTCVDQSDYNELSKIQNSFLGKLAACASAYNSFDGMAQLQLMIIFKSVRDNILP